MRKNTLPVSLILVLTTAIAGVSRLPLGHAAEVYATVSETTFFDSNVYSDASKEWDIIIQPSAGLAVDFAAIYTIGYDGFLEVYPRHSDLLFHSHELYFFANPMFGKDDRNELTAELSVKTHRNSDTYAGINVVVPTAFLSLDFNPRSWLTVTLSETASYRWFYDDTAADGVDSWTKGEISITAPSRTTVKPRVIYAQRYYPRLVGPAASDPLDQQIEVGLRAAQNLFEGAGVRADYAYIHGIGTSASITRNLDDVSFQYLGEAFLLTAHVAEGGLKFLFDSGFGIDAVVTFRDKRYNGWPALDDFGEPLGETRHDRELGPAVHLSYTRSPGEDAAPAVPELDISLCYDYQRNWSNDPWYDTDRHRVWLGFELGW